MRSSPMRAAAALTFGATGISSRTTRDIGTRPRRRIPGCTTVTSGWGRPGAGQRPPGRYDAIFSKAGGCGSPPRRYGPLLQADAGYRDAAAAWDTRLHDIHEWLVKTGCRAPAAAPFDGEVTVTYHDSCHLVHGQK